MHETVSLDVQNLRHLIDQLEKIGEATQHMHVQNEGRLLALMVKVDRHGEILQQYLVRQESWAKMQEEFSGPKGLYVQIANLGSEFASAKAEMEMLRAECRKEVREFREQREAQDQREQIREQEHENNQTKIWAALITGVLAAITSIALGIIELFKK